MRQQHDTTRVSITGTKYRYTASDPPTFAASPTPRLRRLFLAFPLFLSAFPFAPISPGGERERRARRRQSPRELPRPFVSSPRAFGRVSSREEFVQRPRPAPRVWGAFFERRRSFRREQGEASHRRPRSLPIRGLHPAERPRPSCGQVRATTRALLAFPTDILRLHHPHTPHPRSLPPRARRRDSAPPSPARTFPAHVAGEPAKKNAAA